MKVGKMRHTITLQRVGLAPNEYGTEVETWAHLATLRAELVKQEAGQDDAAEAGTAGTLRATFRTRAFGGVTLADRVLWRGKPFAIQAIGGGDFDQASGLELVCEGAA